MAKRKQSNNLDFIIVKLKKSIGDIKVIEYSGGISFGGVHEINIDKGTVTIINEIGLEKIKQAEKENLSTDTVYSDSTCIDIIPLSIILALK